VRAFVTGATGFLGRPIALALRRAGHEVWGLARTVEKGRSLAADEIRPVIGSLEDTETLAAAVRESEIVVHAAADSGGTMFALDRRALETILASARGGPVVRTLLYTSGTWIYGDTGGRLADETAPVHPPAYAAARVTHERMVLGAEGVRGLVLRPGCVYGGQGSLTALWFEGAASGALEIVGDGRARWALVHQDDLADGYVRAAESGLSGEIFNLADGSHASVREMAAAAAHAAGFRGEIRSLAVADAVVRLGAYAECLDYDQQLDSSKAVKLLGWRPRHQGFVPEAPLLFAAWKARESTRQAAAG
jgi:nucleoside-diphosphate-sugar epimerase